jgi:hypothetical protein
VETGNFHNAGILESLNPCVPFNPVVFVFDIRSNVGRDGIYWALQRRVFVLKPIFSTFGTLKNKH